MNHPKECSPAFSDHRVQDRRHIPPGPNPHISRNHLQDAHRIRKRPLIIVWRISVEPSELISKTPCNHSRKCTYCRGPFLKIICE